MSLTALTYIVVDLTALAVLIGIFYAPRHSHKDLMAAYIGVNAGVLAITLLLSTTSVAAGLGLGLFGVLSIIRLRSTELTQYEAACFFAALALGLLGGIQATPIGIMATLMSAAVATLWISDHPALMRRSRHQMIVPDHTIISETALIAHLERTLGGQVSSVEVQRLDLVDDTTTVDVHFRVPRHTPAELGTTTTFDDIAPAAQPATEPIGAAAREAQTTQPWNGTRLSTVQVGSRPESVEAQPLAVAPATQYVTRSSSQAAPSAAVASC